LLTISAPGYRSISRVVTAGAGPVTAVEVRLQPLPGSLEGTITDAASGAGIANATVVLGSERASTDATGRYRFGDLLPGTYTVRVNAAGYDPYEVGVTVAPGARVTAPAALQPLPNIVVVTVVDAATDDPIAGATVAYSTPAIGTGGQQPVGTDGEHACADVALLVPLKRSAAFARIRKRVADHHHRDSWQEDGLHFFVFQLHPEANDRAISAESPVAVFALHPASGPVSAVVVTPGPDGAAEVRDLLGTDSAHTIPTDTP